MTNQVIYPVDRLLANPRVFYAIAERLEGPDGKTLKDAFYDLLEYNLDDFEDPDDVLFEATEVCFRCEDEGAKIEIVLDTGMMSVLEAVEGEVRAAITNDGEFAASSAIYSRLVEAINESHPELRGDIALSSPPTPGNSYLRSPDGDCFEGEFHLLSDPEKTFAFNVEIVDLETDKLKATIKPNF
jgi:hypothetical protein